MALERLFDGWLNYLEPEEDFSVPANLVPREIDGDEDEDLAFGESCTPIVDWAEKANWTDPERLPGQHEEMAWAGLSLALGSLCEIVGGKKNSYQENQWSPDRKKIEERRYAFQFKPGETGFQGGRL